MARKKKNTKIKQAESYRHSEATSPLRPDVGTQSQFRKKKSPVTYTYDSSLSPAIDWDGQNWARERGEELLRQILEADSLEQAKTGAEELKRLSAPFLNWSGKAERLSFDVPTLPLFVHERLSTKAIIETLKGHKTDKQMDMFDLFGDPGHSVSDQVLRAYEHQDQWVNRLVLGDSLVVMNSLLHYENLGGQVQMIYMDPPYGVKFGSNFQPFIRKRDVKHNDDDDMTREPEMVKAYRDTWELGLHTYLTYLRDRLLLCQELLSSRGSIFVQINDENLHHIKELMDEIFGSDNYIASIVFRKKGMTLGAKTLETMNDYIVWYAKDKNVIKYNQLFESYNVEGASRWTMVELSEGTRRKLSPEEYYNHKLLPKDSKVFRLVSQRAPSFSPKNVFDFTFKGKTYKPPGCWVTNQAGMESLAQSDRFYPEGVNLSYIQYHQDFPMKKITNLWTDTSGPQNKVYAVQTSEKPIMRCMLMTTDPGDLVLDPTCGSGTTAYVAEQWGRRWITIDTSRVPLALARQRLLTATFSYYQLKDEKRGPASGFVYISKLNKKGEEIGGIVPHITLKSIANDEPLQEEILVDKPEVDSGITRVTGPFCVEATIPTPVDWEGDGIEDSGAPELKEHASYEARMLEVLRKSPVLHLGGGKAVTLNQVRPPAKTLSLSCEAWVDATAEGQKPSLDDVIHEAAEKDGRELPLSKKPVAIVFGPENGAVSEKLVFEAAREAYAKSYTHLYVIGFAVQANARKLVEDCEEAIGVPATYVQATPDLTMGDLLKNMRSSQIFSVCGLPEIKIHKIEHKEKVTEYQVELLGLDVFDPITMNNDHRKGDDVPAWFLDKDYNGLCFHVSQAFFPRTSAWNSLKKALKGTYDEEVWDHLAGNKSAPFEAGEHGKIAVKVIDDRGNELLVEQSLKEAE